jgi:hypothetical protein
MKYSKSLAFGLMSFVFACAAHADPVAPLAVAGAANAGPQSARATGGAAANPRASRQTTSAGAAAKAGAVAQTKGAQVSSRAVASRAANPRSAANSRSVVARAATAGGASSSAARSVRARVGGVPASSGAQSSARVSLSGSAMRAPTGLTYAGISGAYATYSNIIDPMTGLISAEAYNNCMQGYYTCMDEICTVRSPGQRRCACAGRVKTFANVESTLQSAKEDLLKVSGELTLLIASKGENVNAAFSLTDAEKTMNCVSWRDVQKTGDANDLKAWCAAHLMASDSNCESSGPSYCRDGSIGFNGNDFMNMLNGSDSDIISALQQYASTVDEVNVITGGTNNSGLATSIKNVEDIINSLNDTGETLFGGSVTLPDSLAETWGYELFQYAHNNVCHRVLDACFNGIYEACGSHGGTTGPYNLNSSINVINGGQDLDFKIVGASSSTSTAACYGYTAASGDPYGTLRKPVADARRSVLQKYALDANADCDVYGEELKKQATNMNYQKIAATQLLQQKRLEFATDKENARVSDSRTAKNNFSQCLSDLIECYENQVDANSSWTASRIKTYCQQISNAPTCYEPMICNPNEAPVEEIVDVADDASCQISTEVGKTTCRNVTTLYEIVHANGIPDTAAKLSAKKREDCLQASGVQEIRDWNKGATP